MKFGPVPIENALGTVLAHSVHLKSGRLVKGCVLGNAELQQLKAEGLNEVTVAQPDEGDIGEDVAAMRVAKYAAGAGIELSEPVHGRVNLVAREPGVLRIDGAGVIALNQVDEAITLATLPDFARVQAGSLVATAKMIPYFVRESLVSGGCRQSKALCRVHPFRPLRWALLLTRTRGLKDSLLSKARQVTQARIKALGGTLVFSETVGHSSSALAAEIEKACSGGAEVVLILTGSATSDRGDVAPQGLKQAGGELTRFGMPVDPGNLLFLGRVGHCQVVGLPGCARAPALNGADWVLERIAAGLPVETEDIAAMGAGGLLKEVPERGEPRQRRSRKSTNAKASPEIHVLLLAAGASRRMRGEDKLIRQIEGTPLLRRTALAATDCKATKVHVTVPADDPERLKALDGLAVNIVPVEDAAEGMAASLAAGIRALPASASAVIVALADMPDLTCAHYDALIEAAQSGEPQTIFRAQSASGVPGHPVLFGKVYFPDLTALNGDLGARSLLLHESGNVRLIPTEGEGVLTDLDTPEAFAAWENKQATLVKP